MPRWIYISGNIEEAKYYIYNFIIGTLSLDHDLGANEKGELLPTGYDFVKYICEKGLKKDNIYIHTDNPVGRDNMYFTLLGAQKRGFLDREIHIYQFPLVPNKFSDH